ncbi:MAG TPA: Rrf2 family transcriptional regulator [Pirellulaceae bacterium]|nr:Rrf2 family transcriptional regulator [Pirellulaceae bacterium]
MIVSAKTEYACIAVLELAARHASGEPVRIRDIAETHGVPSRFLVQILLQLKSAGLVQSIRGAAGGYQLAREPDEISLLDVMTVVDPQLAQVPASATRSTATTRALQRTWKRVATAERDLLAEVTFADLVEQLKGTTEGMYYI